MFKAGSHVSQDAFKLMHAVAKDVPDFMILLQYTGIIGVYHNAQFMQC